MSGLFYTLINYCVVLFMIHEIESISHLHLEYTAKYDILTFRIVILFSVKLSKNS